MAKKQTRRSISINRQLFEVAKKQAAKKNKSLSSMTEDALRVAIAKDANPELGAVIEKLLHDASAVEAN